jgi:hypothetical protein
VLDKHTLRFTVAGVTWMPIPGGRRLNIPALLTVKLPDTVTYGNEFRVTVHQVSGLTRKVVGSSEFRIVVSKAELILDQERRDLSVFKHILSTIPPDNRWYPLWQRYVYLTGQKVDALGGHAEDVHPNPDGSGRPYEPVEEEGGRPRPGGIGLDACCEALSELACKLACGCLRQVVQCGRALLRGCGGDRRRHD